MEKKYPLTAGYKENSTSKEAAKKINSRAANLRTECLDIVKNSGNYGATPEEVAKWEQEDFFRAGNFDAMKLFVVVPTIIQLFALAFMFSIILFNDQVF